MSQNSVRHLSHIGDCYGYHDPDPDPDAASPLVLCSVSKLAAGMELEGEETCIIRKPGQPVLACWVEDSVFKTLGRSVLSDQQTCIHPNQGDQFWGDDTRQTNRCLLGNEWHYFIHNKKHCQDAMTYKIGWELECWNFALYHFGSWSR